MLKKSPCMRHSHYSFADILHQKNLTCSLPSNSNHFWSLQILELMMNLVPSLIYPNQLRPTSIANNRLTKCSQLSFVPVDSISGSNTSTRQSFFEPYSY